GSEPSGASAHSENPRLAELGGWTQSPLNTTPISHVLVTNRPTPESRCDPTIMTAPPALRTLISKYQETTQSHVRFRPPTWERTLGSENSALSVLTDDRYSSKDASIPSDRNTDREHVKALADSADLDDEN